MKPKVAFFDFASCEGCQLQIANLEEDIIDLIKLVDIVSFREVMKEHSEYYDIAIVEGSIVRPIDEKRLQWIRGRCNILVAMGACAHIGGVNSLRNQFSVKEANLMVYGDIDIKGNPYFEASKLKTLDEVVKVDYHIPGCPIDKKEFVRFMTALAVGKIPRLPNYPVCVECKAKENICVFDEGGFCLGPVTRAGCDARCPTNGDGCKGCRGFIDDPNINSAIEILQKHGLSLEDALDKFNLFCYKEGVKL